MNRFALRAFLLLACGLIAAGALVACGGGDEKDPGAQQLIDETFGASTTAIVRAKVNASLELDPEGLLRLGGPIKLKVTGPFALSGKPRVPRFDFDIAARLASQNFTGGVVSTGKKGFVRLDDRAYTVDDAFVSNLRKSIGSATKKGGLTALGVDPRQWISDPEVKGTERVAGVDSRRVGGNVDVARMLGDVSELLDRVTGSGGGGFLSPELRKTLSAAVDSAKVDVWTGEADRLLRQILVTIDFAFKDGQQSPITGLDGGKLTIRLRLDDVNGAPVKIAAPSGARSLSKLTRDKNLGAFLKGLGSSITGGSKGDGGTAFLRCLTGAGGKSAEIVRCASKLS